MAKIIVWITKYALTEGIQKRWVETYDDDDSMVKEVAGQPGHGQYYHVNTWHLSESDAIKRANKMRDEKIKSMEKKIAALKTIKF